MDNDSSDNMNNSQNLNNSSSNNLSNNSFSLSDPTVSDVDIFVDESENLYREISDSDDDDSDSDSDSDIDIDNDSDNDIDNDSDNDNDIDNDIDNDSDNDSNNDNDITQNQEITISDTDPIETDPIGSVSIESDSIEEQIDNDIESQIRSQIEIQINEEMNEEKEEIIVIEEKSLDPRFDYAESVDDIISSDALLARSSLLNNSMNKDIITDTKNYNINTNDINNMEYTLKNEIQHLREEILKLKEHNTDIERKNLNFESKFLDLDRDNNILKKENATLISTYSSYYEQLYDLNKKYVENETKHIEIGKTIPENNFLEMILSSIIYDNTSQNMRLIGSACKYILSPEKFRMAHEINGEVVTRDLEFVGIESEILAFKNKLVNMGKVTEKIIYNKSLYKHTYYEGMHVKMIEEITLHIGIGKNIFSDAFQFYASEININSNITLKIILYTMNVDKYSNNFEPFLTKWILNDHSLCYTIYSKGKNSISCEEFVVKSSPVVLSDITIGNIWMSLKYQKYYLNCMRDSNGNHTSIIDHSHYKNTKYLGSSSYSKYLRRKLICHNKNISYLKPLGEIYVFQYKIFKKAINNYIDHNIESPYIMHIMKLLDKDLPNFKDKNTNEIITSLFGSINEEDIFCSISQETVNDNDIFVITPCGHIYLANYIMINLIQYCESWVNRANSNNTEDNISPKTRTCPLCDYELIDFNCPIANKYNNKLAIKDSNVEKNFSKFFYFFEDKKHISFPLDRVIYPSEQNNAVEQNDIDPTNENDPLYGAFISSIPILSSNTDASISQTLNNEELNSMRSANEGVLQSILNPIRPTIPSRSAPLPPPRSSSLYRSQTTGNGQL